MGWRGPADVIAVGAYATKQSWFSCAQEATCAYYVPTALGALAYFSNPGPRRDGVVRPDLAAPGFGVATTHSTQAGAIGLCGDVDDGVHEIQAGTSFSAPHVAGAAALFLESRPGSPPAVVRRSLQGHARTDAYTGAVPNGAWGYGKLDVYASIDHTAPAALLTAPNLGESWEGGTVHDITWTATDSLGVTAIRLDYSLHGPSGPWVAIAQDLANSGSYPWTVPAVATDSRQKAT